MSQLSIMLKKAFDKISSTQGKRNDARLRMITTKRKLEELQDMKEREIKRLGKANKSTNLELKKTQAELKTIDDEIAVTEYNRDENPETYTTDELTVARAIRNAILIMKMHQLFCENHNPTL